MPPFTPAPRASFTPPSPNPTMSARMRPTSQIQERSLFDRGARIGQKFQPLRTAQIGSTKARLKRYGGYQVNDDGSIDTQQQSQPGQAYKEAYRGELDSFNARGVMDSSFAAKQIGAAFGRLSAEAQEIVTQHAVSFNQLIAQEASEFDEINQSLLQLYGDEAQYMLDNPPPPPQDPAPAAPQPNQAPAGINQAAMSPGFRVTGGGNVVTSYHRTDLTPANRAKLAKQFPGYQLVISGDGRVVMKKVS